MKYYFFLVVKKYIDSEVVNLLISRFASFGGRHGFLLAGREQQLCQQLIN